MKVAVYWNVHKKTFSIQSREKETYGRVIRHANSVVINSPKFVIRQAGREKVLKEGSKNVHAFVKGILEWASDKEYRLKGGRKVTYNPYKYNSFVIADTKEQVAEGIRVSMSTYNNHPVMELFE